MNPDREKHAAEQLKSSLFEALEGFFAIYLEQPDEKPSDSSDHRLRLAIAVLIVEITRADFEITEDERLAIRDAVTHALGLTEEETERLVIHAQSQSERSVPLHRYTDYVNQHCSPEQKKRLIECLWRVAFSDAFLLPHEEYLVRKTAELLHVPKADFIEAKIRAREAFR